MLQLWTISNLQRLEYSIRKKIVFYAPLVETLHFYGIDPCEYIRLSTESANYRGGTMTVGNHVPAWNFIGDMQLGLYFTGPATLRYNPANGLNNANTLVWFENRIPKSTPTQANPFDANGAWVGNLAICISHIAKANTVLANSEINAIQSALLTDVPAQVIPPPPEPPLGNIGSPITETPSGARNGLNYVFTLSQAPDLGSLELFWAGLYLKRVASAPDTLEYTASGAGNRTLTLGSAPSASEDLTAVYFVYPS